MSQLLSVGVLHLLMALGAGEQGLLLGVPPAAEDPAMAAVAPPQCLAYLAWAGTAAPNGRSENRTERFLADPEVQSLLAAVRRTAHGAILSYVEKEQPAAKQVAVDGLDIAMKILTRPTAVYLGKLVPPSPNGPPVISAGLIVNLGNDAAQVWATLSRYQQQVGLPWQTVKIGEDSYQRVRPGPDAPEITFGLHGKYLLIGIGEGEVEGMLQRMGQTPAPWLTAVRNRLAVERPSTFVFVNVKEILAKFSGDEGQAMAMLEILGLKNITAYATITGLGEGGFVSRTLVGVKGEPEGILAILKQKPLTADDLAPLPKDAITAFALRMDLDVAWQKVLAMAAAQEKRLQAGAGVSLPAEATLAGKVAALESQLGWKLRDDLFAALGDVWCISAAPAKGPLPIPRVLAVVKLRDAKRFAATHAKLLAIAEGAMKGPAPAGGQPGPQITRQQLGGREVFTLQTGQPGVPVAPSWCITDTELVFALSADALQAYAAGGAGAGSLADVPAVARMLTGDAPAFALAYQDTPQIVRTAYPALLMFLPMVTAELKKQGIELDLGPLPSPDTMTRHLKPSVSAIGWGKVGLQTTTEQTLPGENMVSASPVAVALLLPAVQAAREAARRTQSSNNLKQIGLALHCYHDVHKSFPPAYTTTKDGKPGLSWRVLILPFVEQQPLFQQFHLDEPWDSEHNKKLLAKIPPTYVVPNYPGAPGKTNYLGIGGEKGIFGGAKGLTFPQITDGTSNTVMVVEANNASAIEWTKPDVFLPDAEQPTKGLTGLRPGGFNALFADGSVRFLQEKIAPKILRAMFTYNGGEVVQE